MSLKIDGRGGAFVMEAAGGMGPVGKTVVFCNGVNNSAAAARLSAERLAVACARAPYAKPRVYVFHNPTGLLGVSSPVDPVLVAKMVSVMEQCTRDGNLCLFAHSHGALVVRQALEAVPAAIRGKVEVYACGGIDVIPSHLASRVHNYVLEGDASAAYGRGIWCKEGDPVQVATDEARKQRQVKVGGVSLPVMHQGESFSHRVLGFGKSKLDYQVTVGGSFEPQIIDGGVGAGGGGFVQDHVFDAYAKMLEGVAAKHSLVF